MDIQSLKPLLSTLAIMLTFIGYVPYIRSILQKKTTPHLYSWCIWTLDGLIIFALQITHGAGAGSFVALSATLLSLTVVILTLLGKAKQDITTTDKIFSGTALIALALWVFAKQPILSSILIMIVDIFAFVPTVRKSWNKPHSENPMFYAINVVRFGFAFMALQEYTIITLLYPAIWFVGNIFFTAMLLIRRKLI